MTQRPGDGGAVDDDGFRAFAHSRLAYLSRVAYLLAGDHHAAEDLVQNTLVRLATAWPKVAAAGDPVAYARRVLYNEHVSTWRRARHLRAERSTDTLPDVADLRRDEADDVVRRLMLERALRRLTHRQRAVIVLRFFEDLSPDDAAEVLGCSPGTVKSQTHHALRRMRELSPELATLVNEMPEALV
jgi:RNA polymerase sigma-70 factor (sigma-E family)